MRLLCSLFLLIFPNALLLAQITPPAAPAAVFPARVATLTDLQRAANLSYSILTTPANSTALSLTVASPTVFPIPTTVTIDSEIIRVCGTTVSTLVVCAGGRGSEGTAPSAHAASTYVQQRLTAAMHNQMAAEIIALETRAKYQLYVTDFGAQCDGVTDDAPALRAAITAAAATSGATIWIPPTTINHRCMIGSSLDLPQGAPGIIFRGQSPGNASGIAALPGGTWSTYIPNQSGTVLNPAGVPHTYMVSIGGGSCTNAISYEMVMDMTLAGNGQVDTAALNQCGEEQTGYFNILMGGGLYSQLQVQRSSAQNSRYADLNIFPLPGSVGIYADSPSRLTFSNITINGGHAGAPVFSPSNGSIGVWINGNGMVVENIHCENTDICVKVNALAEISNIDCGPFLNVACVENHGSVLINGMTGLQAPYGASQEIKDYVNGDGTTIQGNGEGFYYSIAGGTLLSSSPGVAWKIPDALSLGGALTIPGPVNMGAVQMSTSANQELNLVITNPNPLGVFVQSNLTPGYGTREGGGLALNGGGYAGNPSYGSVMSGAAHDGGTFVATAPTAQGFTMQTGRVNFFANTGLSVDYQFGPYYPGGFDKNGFQFTATATAPPCTSGADHGRLWVNSSTTPNRLEMCMDNGWRIVTTTAGP